MENGATPAELRTLFANGDPDEVWARAVDIVRRIDPAFDFSLSRMAFGDVIRLFRGEYPGYRAISTLYHNLHHTLDVFLCAVRLLHGVHLSGNRLGNDEITRIMIAALMHDVGYAQLKGDNTGTGAKYTQIHVGRSIDFMRSYFAGKSFPSDWATLLEPMIRCTDPSIVPSRINFPDERTRLLGWIVGTADLVGQIADRTYLEKLLFLYFEFKEAQLGDYQSTHDLLRRTQSFYELTRKKLDGEFGGIYALLAFHFNDRFGVERNYYLESIEKNIAYLAQVTRLDEAEYFSMLKRGGVVEEVKSIHAAGSPPREND